MEKSLNKAKKLIGSLCKKYCPLVFFLEKLLEMWEFAGLNLSALNVLGLVKIQLEQNCSDI